MRGCNQVYDDNRTAIGTVKSVRRVPISRSLATASRVTEMYEIEMLKQEIAIDEHKIPLADLYQR